MTFGEKIKELRLSKNITQRELAAQLDIAPSMYNRFEKNERRIKHELLYKLSELLDITEEELNKYWVADQIYKLLECEKNPNDVISLVSENLNKYLLEE